MISTEFLGICAVTLILTLLTGGGDTAQTKYVLSVINVEGSNMASYYFASASVDSIHITITRPSGHKDEFDMTITDSTSKNYTKTEHPELWTPTETVTGKYDTGLEITGNGSFSVTGRIYGSEIGGAFLGISVADLGTTYYVMTYHTEKSQGATVTITATEDATSINILLNIPETSVIVYNQKEYRNGETIIDSLTALQTFQVIYFYTSMTNRDRNQSFIPVLSLFEDVCAKHWLQGPILKKYDLYTTVNKYCFNLRDPIGEMKIIKLQCQCDLTGTKINATKPVAVFAGSKTAVFAGENVDTPFLDLIVEQLPDVKRWGNTHLTANSYMRGTAEIFRILTTDLDNSVIVQKKDSSENPKMFKLEARQHYDHISQRNEYYVINSTNPVMIGHFTSSKKSDGSLVGTSFVVLTPKDLYDTRLIANTPASTDEQAYMNIFMPTVYSSSLVLDDKLSQTKPTTYFATFAYALLNLVVSDGRHDYHATSPNVRIDGHVYGTTGQKWWYAYRLSNPLKPDDPDSERYIQQMSTQASVNDDVVSKRLTSRKSETTRVVGLVVGIVVGLPLCLLLFCFIKTSVNAYERRQQEKKEQNDSFELNERR